LQLYGVNDPDHAAISRGVAMPPLAIDLHGVTSDLLLPTDNPVLADAVLKAIDPKQPMGGGAGFDNKL
jgi:hypothetical protein